MGRNDPVYVEAEVVFSRDEKNAILFRIENEEIWIPKSLILEGSDLTADEATDGDEGTLAIPQWLAEREGLG